MAPPISVVEHADVSGLDCIDCGWCVSLVGSVSVLLLTWTHMYFVFSCGAGCVCWLFRGSVRPVD